MAGKQSTDDRVTIKRRAGLRCRRYIGPMDNTKEKKPTNMVHHHKKNRIRCDGLAYNYDAVVGCRTNFENSTTMDPR